MAYTVVEDYVTGRQGCPPRRRPRYDVKQGGHASERRLVSLEGKEGKEFVELLSRQKHSRPTPVAAGAVCCSATRRKLA